MYVKAYLDLSLRSLVFSLCVASWPVRLGAWPGGSLLPWRAVPVLLFVCFSRDFCRMVLSVVSRSYLHNGLRPN